MYLLFFHRSYDGRHHDVKSTARCSLGGVPAARHGLVTIVCSSEADSRPQEWKSMFIASIAQFSEDDVLR